MAPFSRGNRENVDRLGTALRMVYETYKLGFDTLTGDERDAYEGCMAQMLGVFGTGLVPRDAFPAGAWVEQLASAARAASTNGPDQVNVTARGALVVLNLTAFVTAASVQLTVERKNADATYAQIAAAAALTAVNRSVVLIDPLAGAEPAGIGDSVSLVLPRDWRVRVVHGNANSHTYSVTAYPIR